MGFYARTSLRHPQPLFPLVLLAMVASVLAARDRSSGTVGATPHDSYSSSVGVLGCKVDTNRIAYWPDSVSCDDICVSLSYEDRSVKLLRIDQSQGAYDVSYDAWNYLYTGHSATDEPTAGGAVEMHYKRLDASECSDLIHTDGHKLPLSAPNSMNFLASCLADSDSWIAKNYVLYNIADSVCSMGYDEQCSLDWPDANQPSCKHTLGDNSALDDAPVYNILYPSGDRVEASTGQQVNGDSDGDSDSNDDDDAAGSLRPPSLLLGTLLILCLSSAGFFA